MDEIESQSLQKQTSFKTPGTTLDFTPISKTEAVLAEEIQTVTEPKVSVEKVGFDDIQMDQDSVQPQAVPAERPRIGNTRVEPDDKNILGLISVFCFFFAAFLLIKFSIASGWLTPARQILLATLTGWVFTLTSFYRGLSDRKYMSQLPASGIVILNLVVYGAAFYHKLISPATGLFFISLIGLWSILLLQYLKRDLFAVLSVVGVYLGAAFFSGSFEQLLNFGVFLIVWAIVFGVFSVMSKYRSLLFIAGYIALGLFGLKAFDATSSNFPQSNISLIPSIIFVQSAQFIIFAIGTMFYSIFNRTKLESSDTWIFFPLILFYYGQIYFFVESFSPGYALGFALILSVFIFILYSFARTRLEGELASRNMVYSVISLILCHSIYFANFTDRVRVISVLIAGFVFVFLKFKRVNADLPVGTKASIVIMVLYSYLLVLGGYTETAMDMAAAFAYGVLGLLCFRKMIEESLVDLNTSILPQIVLGLGNAQIATGIWRLGKYTTETAITPLWMIFGIVLLVWSVGSKNAVIARQALVLVCVCFVRFMIFQFSSLSMANMILSLFIVGALVFVCGYLYRYALRQASAS